jgi:hypothetical protein
MIAGHHGTTTGTWWERFETTGDGSAADTTDGLAKYLGISTGQARLVRDLLDRRGGSQSLDVWASDPAGLPPHECESWAEQAPATFLGAHHVELVVGRQDIRREFAVIVWDRPPGQVVLVFELGEEGRRDGKTQFPAEAATAVSRVLAPVWWQHARIFVPTAGPDYQEPEYTQVVLSGEAVSRPRGLIRKRVAAESEWHVDARRTQVCEAETLAGLLGGPVPAWSAAARTWQYVSDWAVTLRPVESTAVPLHFRELFAGLRHLAKLDVPEQYPALFGQIARVVRHYLLIGLAGAGREPGPHWEWAVRLTGSAPNDIIELLDDNQAAGPAPIPSAEYLPLLETADRGDDQDAEAWTYAVRAIATAVPDLPWPGYGVHVRTVLADGQLLRRWLDGLAEIDDEHRTSIRLAELTRRVWQPERYLRDAHGRYVVAGWDSHTRQLSVAAEWPTAGRAPALPDAAVVAADRPGDDVPVFVVRTTGGGVSIEPLPAGPGDDLGYGLGARTPNTLYESLISAAGGDPAAHAHFPGDSELLARLRTATGALRLSWAWAREQARADIRRADAAHEKFLTELTREHRGQRP